MGKYWLGKHHSEEYKRKMSKTMKGIQFSEEHKKHLSESAKGRILSEETIKKMSESQKGRVARNKGIKGKPHSEGTKKKISEALKKEKHPNWKGGITPENKRIRQSFEMNEWRKAVFERDNYTCQLCGDNKGGNLRAHHIEKFNQYPNKRFDVDNGLTLCKDCHKLVHKSIFIWI